MNQDFRAVQSQNNLSVIIPVFNAREYIQETLNHLLKALENTKLDSYEVLIVDDGSTDSLVDEIENFKSSNPSAGIRLIQQANQGRLLARLKGLKEAKHSYCLLIDSRVLISATSLADSIPPVDQFDSTIVSGPCRFPDNSSLLELYWDSVTKIVWSNYHRSPRRMLLTNENFNKLPKGTTCLLAPVDVLLNETVACMSELTLSKDLVNDDTSILRNVVSKTNYWIDPNLDAIYQPRSSLGKFISHAFHRGKVFTHGFLGTWSRFKLLLLSILILATFFVMVFAALLWPGLFLMGVVTSAALLTAYCIRIKLSVKNLLSLYVYTPFFLSSYGSGLVSGLLKTLLKKNS